MLTSKIEEKLQKQLCAILMRRAAFIMGLFLSIGAAHEIVEGNFVNISKAHQCFEVRLILSDLVARGVAALIPVSPAAAERIPFLMPAILCGIYPKFFVNHGLYFPVDKRRRSAVAVAVGAGIAFGVLDKIAAESGGADIAYGAIDFVNADLVF